MPGHPLRTAAVVNRVHELADDPNRVLGMVWPIHSPHKILPNAFERVPAHASFPIFIHQGYA